MPWPSIRPFSHHIMTGYKPQVLTCTSEPCVLTCDSEPSFNLASVRLFYNGWPEVGSIALFIVAQMLSQKIYAHWCHWLSGHDGGCSNFLADLGDWLELKRLLHIRAGLLKGRHMLLNSRSGNQVCRCAACRQFHLKFFKTVVWVPIWFADSQCINGLGFEGILKSKTAIV